MYVCDRLSNLLHQPEISEVPWQLPSPAHPRSKRPAVPHPRLHITHPSTLCSTRTISNSFFLLLGPSQTSPSLPCVFLLLPTTGQYTTVPTARHAACQQLSWQLNIDIYILHLHSQPRTDTITLQPNLFASTPSPCPPAASLTDTTESAKIHGIDHTVSPARGRPGQLRLFLSARGKVSAPSSRT